MQVPGVSLITVCSIMAVGSVITPAGAENPESPRLHTPPNALTVPSLEPIIAVPIAMLRAADQKPVAPVQQQESRKPKDGAKLQPGTEERLQWGKPVNGLRAALVIRPSSDEPKARDMRDLYLVVQNVSSATILFQRHRRGAEAP
jgi:hypothetical protein